MMYWPWDLIGENMQLCLAGLRDVDRLVKIYTYDAFAQYLMKHQNGIRLRLFHTLTMLLGKHQVLYYSFAFSLPLRSPRLLS